MHKFFQPVEPASKGVKIMATVDCIKELASTIGETNCLKTAVELVKVFSGVNLLNLRRSEMDASTYNGIGDAYEIFNESSVSAPETDIQNILRFNIYPDKSTLRETELLLLYQEALVDEHKIFL